MTARLSAYLVFCLAARPACPQQPPTQPQPTRQEMLELANETVRAHMGWGPELNSPGTALIIRELSREGGTVSFGLRATGVPKDKLYVLFQWPVTQAKPVPALRGVTFDDNDVAVCAGRPGTCGKPDKPNDPIELTTIPALGEPFRFAIAAEDDAGIKAYAKAVPLPVEAEDKGCRLRAVVLAPRATLVGVEASGFPSGSTLDVHTDSAGEIHDTKQIADQSGRYIAAVFPVKAGTPAGTIRIRVSSGDCKPEISLPWAVSAKK